jgi:RNA polymerase sigma-70 factor (ECF subfamily)
MYRDRKEDQEDLFQEIVYQLWKSFPSFKGDSKVSTWIYRVALNTAMAIYRKQRVPISYHEELGEHIHPHSEAGISENEERLFLALRTLSDPDKAVISLFLEDFSYREMADIIGITESNVAVRLNRIKVKLKKMLN